MRTTIDDLDDAIAATKVTVAGIGLNEILNATKIAINSEAQQISWCVESDRFRDAFPACLHDLRLGALRILDMIARVTPEIMAHDAVMAEDKLREMNKKKVGG